MRLRQSGRLAEAFRFAPYGAVPLLGHLERRPGIGLQPLGEFVYDSAKGVLNTVALDGGMIADHIRFQVRHAPSCTYHAVNQCPWLSVG